MFYLPKAHIRYFRHTNKYGEPIETVSKIPGYSSIKTTQIYGRIVDEKILEDMKRLKTMV